MANGNGGFKFICYQVRLIINQSDKNDFNWVGARTEQLFTLIYINIVITRCLLKQTLWYIYQRCAKIIWNLVLSLHDIQMK